MSSFSSFCSSWHPGKSYVGFGFGSTELISSVYASIKAGRILDMESEPTLSDGSAGGIEPGAVTFPICQELVDDFILVSEAEIISALRLIMEKHYLLIEGAAALSVASFIQQIDRFQGKNVVLILSGSKISLETLKKILSCRS